RMTDQSASLPFSIRWFTENTHIIWLAFFFSSSPSMTEHFQTNVSSAKLSLPLHINNALQH
ncbi:hypothetical protein, partial [Idiomarina sp. UBA4206]|uniref:hypothetical protein n=1 Tax=Idiomarina sp. UBA4206 TaxID=1946644 RepID=UPI002580CD16